MYLFSMSYKDRTKWPLWRLGLRAFQGVCFGLLCLSVVAAAQELSAISPTAGPSELFRRVIANQKQSETDLAEYEFTQRVEKRKTESAHEPSETKVWRVFPTGPGTDRLALSADGKPLSVESYRGELEELERYLGW